MTINVPAALLKRGDIAKSETDTRVIRIEGTESSTVRHGGENKVVVSVTGIDPTTGQTVKAVMPTQSRWSVWS